jgi:glucose-6-phosphate dehydrogenase assembly protein OpcA
LAATGSGAISSSEDAVWSAQDTTPSKIEAALRALLAERHQQAGTVQPARILNMVVICDREYRGEIENRLKHVGRFQASRTLIVAVEPKRTTLDAWASMATADDGVLSVSRERVEVDVGPSALEGLANIVAPLVVPDLATLVWAPHGHPVGVDALRQMAQIVLVDTLEDDVGPALDRAAALQEDLYVVDLAWLRSTPWRERVAAAFDPPAYRDDLRTVSAVTVRHREDSVAPAALFAGWLAARLHWSPSRMLRRGDGLTARCTTRRGDVKVTFEPVEQRDVPGLAGVTVESASGASVSLDRARGGLREVRRTRKGDEEAFTVMGASRGEGGILGAGVRAALLRDRTYKPALAAARELVSG